MKKITLSIDGITCSACSNGLENYLNKQNGIINSSMFMGKPSENIVINFIFPENTITIIEDFAFNGLHKNLKEVKIPDSVITINDNAFALNYSLEKITLGNNIHTIVKNAFHYSTALKELTIPASVKVIKSGAFFRFKRISINYCYIFRNIS